MSTAASNNSSPTHKTIVIPVDGSNEAATAFAYAVKMTNAGDKLVLFHGEPQAFNLTTAGGMIGVVETDKIAARNTQLLHEEYMKKCRAANRTCEWVSKEFLGGSSTIAADIVKTSTAYNADSIVMGARGLSALGSVVLGSVSQGVLHRSSLPVTVVKTPMNQTDFVRDEVTYLQGFL